MNNPDWMADMRAKAEAADRLSRNRAGEITTLLSVESLTRLGLPPPDAELFAALPPHHVLWLLDMLREADDEHIEKFISDGNEEMNNVDTLDWSHRLFDGPGGSDV